MEENTLTPKESVELAEATRKARAESFRLLAEVHAEVDPIIDARREAEE